MAARTIIMNRRLAYRVPRVKATPVIVHNAIAWRGPAARTRACASCRALRRRRGLEPKWSHGNPMDFLKSRYTPMSRRRRIYEGKAKVLYEGPEPGTLIQHFKDDATAFNAKKHQVIEGKGVLNNRISEYVFQHLNDIGVPTHF